MKCVCVRLRDKSRDDPWLTLGREYDVLSILVVPGRLSVLRILADDGRTPILVESSAFEMVSQEIPSNWFCVISEGGVVELGPEAWLQDGFWERYFDGDAVAVEQFWQDVQRVSGS